MPSPRQVFFKFFRHSPFFQKNTLLAGRFLVFMGERWYTKDNPFWGNPAKKRGRFHELLLYHRPAGGPPPRQRPEPAKTLTEYGCNIKLRVGLHETGEDFCSDDGVIMLQACGDQPPSTRWRRPSTPWRRQRQGDGFELSQPPGDGGEAAAQVKN